MFHLHVSNRTEHLLRHLAEVLRVSERRSFFEKEVFLIQSQGVERLISQYLADTFRSWCNFSYLLPLNFLGQIAEKLEIPIAPDGWERRAMIWRIEDLLRNLDGEVYGQLVDYLKGEQVELKRFQLARQLAHIYDQYQVMRLDMLTGWENGITSTESTAEHWQMALWLKLKDQLAEVPHRGALLQNVIEVLTEAKDLSPVLPKRVSIFGLHTMPPLFLEYFNALARHVDIHMYTLSPCRHYWGDIENKRQLLRRQLQIKEQSQPGDQGNGVQHPLLASLGQQGRDFQRILLERVEFKIEFESFSSPFKEESNSLLKRLQQDLLEGKVEKLPAPMFEEDTSLHIVSCHSKMREVAILKDYLLNLLYDDATLELRDMVVMAPDIQEYASFIPAIFHDIQHSVADRSLRRKNRYISVFLDFLRIFQGRFGWSEIMDLLHKEVVAETFSLTESDLQILQKWIIESGIRWGLSAGQRGEMGLPEFSESSWRAGIDRLLLGYAMYHEKEVVGILPYGDIEGGTAQALGGLCQFMDIIERAETDFTQRNNIEEWAGMLLSYCEELFGKKEERELLELQGILAELDTTYGRFHRGKIGFDVIRAWLTYATEETLSSSGFLSGQLTFCSMLPMRSIPFKVVCLLGLNDGIFPKTDKWATFDLMGEKTRAGDRSRRSDDRYQFLEAMLAARENLYLSYVGQSIMTNEELPPSVVVTELIELLEKGYGVMGKVVVHPLHPFSRRYFQATEKHLYSYNKHHCKTAEMLLQEPVEKKGWWSGKLENKPKQIQINDLLQFYSNPHRFFVRNCLNINLTGEEVLPADSEIFTLNPLEEYLISQDIATSLLNDENPENLLGQLHHQGRWPLGNIGKIEYAKRIEEISSFTQRIKSLEMGKRIADVKIDLTVGSCNLTGTLGNLYEKGLVLARYASLKGGDILSGWLHYLLLSRLQEDDQQIMVIAKDAEHCFTASHAVPVLEELVLHFLEGCRTPSPLYVEPAFAYVRHMGSKRSKITPLEKAENVLLHCLENGYEPEWALLLSGNEDGNYLAGEFEHICHEIMVPIWGAANEN